MLMLLFSFQLTLFLPIFLGHLYVHFVVEIIVWMLSNHFSVNTYCVLQMLSRTLLVKIQGWGLTMRSSFSFINAWVGAFSQVFFFIVIVFFPLLEKTQFEELVAFIQVFFFIVIVFFSFTWKNSIRATFLLTLVS